MTANIRHRHGGEAYTHPYDLGLYHNLNEIMGASAVGWVLPPCAPTPGGTAYPTVWDEQALGLGLGPGAARGSG